MAPVVWLVIAIAVVFGAVGWPAELLARRPGPRAGLAWFGLTFCAPAFVWIPIGVLADSNSDAAGVIEFFGYLASVAAVFVGTMVSRAIRRPRKRRA